MKKNIVCSFNVLLLTALSFLATCCQKHNDFNDGTIKLSNLVWSSCIPVDSVTSVADSVSCCVHDGKIFIERYNHAETCGFDTILIDITLTNDTLFFYEKVYPQYDNNCLCIINSSFQVNDIPTGTYTLLFKRNNIETIYSQTITLS